MRQKRIGIDTGGTFTDVVVFGRGRLTVHKTPSTPRDPGVAVLNGLSAVRRPDEPVDVVHGTTVGINAILTGKLARTAFVTNEGFEDLIEIGRQDRLDIYDLAARKATIPVPRALRFGIDSRRGADGTRLAKPGRTALTALRERLRRARVESIAIGLLHSYRDPADEHEIAAALRSLGVPITCSADLLRASGEYERFTAAILNAATRPEVSAYVDRLRDRVQPGQLRLMRSSGGILSAEEASEFPARAMFSGPAGGVVATRALAQRAGFGDVAALDMGGTSTDVCLVQPHTTVGDSEIAGLPLAIPSVEVHTVGCGGGSIARIDAGGALRVGPESAGADPGPACYGIGDEPTVTDAHVCLGHFGADSLLDGAFPIDPDRAVRAVERLGRRLGLSSRKTAEGILQIAEVHMMRALLVITVQRAIDPATVPLVAYGGAGGLHAARLRALLDMPEAIVPEHPGAFSAVGLALAGETEERRHPVFAPVDAIDPKRLRAMAAALADEVRADLPGRVRVRVEAALRYAGQGAALSVPLRFPLAGTLARAHARRFGFVPEGRPLELVELRARAATPTRALPVPPRADRTRLIRCATSRRPLCGGPAIGVYSRAELPEGAELAGPCVIEEPTGTTVVPTGTDCRVETVGLRLRRDLRGR